MGLRDGISLFSVQRKVERMNSETRELAGQAVKKLRSGATLSDEELRAGIEVLSVVVPCLRELGLMYHLPYSALSRALDELKGFRDARREGKPVYTNSWSDDWSKIEDEVEKNVPSGWRPGIDMARHQVSIALTEFLKDIPSDQKKGTE